MPLQSGLGLLTQASTPGSDRYRIRLAYDKAGRIIHKVEATDGTGVAYAYRYDDAGRLEEVDRATLGATELDDDCTTIVCPASERYTYDANGNRSSAAYNGAAAATATYDAQDRLLTRGTTSYSHNAHGDRTRKLTPAGTTLTTYDVFGSLRRATLPNGDVVEYVLDPQQRRVGRKLNGALDKAWVYRDGLNPIAELEADGKTVAARFMYATRGHVPDFMEKAGQTYRIVTDQLGSVRMVINVADGTVAQVMEYDAYGRVVADSNPGFQPFGFAGGLYDAATGLVRFGARDYDADAGRWTTKDPIKFDGGLNLYTYTHSEPVNLIDPTGLVSQSDLLDLADMLGVGTIGRGIVARRDAPMKAASGDIDGLNQAAGCGAGKILGGVGEFSAGQAVGTVVGVAAVAVVGKIAVRALGRVAGPLKQWIRMGPSYSRVGDFGTRLSIKIGASPAKGGRKFVAQIPSIRLRYYNQVWLRDLKFPGKSWRVADRGHFHIWR